MSGPAVQGRVEPTGQAGSKGAMAEGKSSRDGNVGHNVPGDSWSREIRDRKLHHSAVTSCVTE